MVEETSSRGGGGGARRRCRYGAECRHKHCKFSHPPTTEASDSESPGKNSPKNKRDRSKIQCRYGMECRNTKCPYFHHPAGAAMESPTPPRSSPIQHRTGKPIPVDAITSNSPSRKTTAKKNKKNCRWGDGCRNKKCTFVHPGQDIDKDALNSTKTEATLPTEERGNITLLSQEAPSNVTEGEPFMGPSGRSILPPQQVTQETADGLQFPSPSTAQISPISIGRALPETFENMQPFNNMFGDAISERTPLYNKCPSAFQDHDAIEACTLNGAHNNNEHPYQPTTETFKDEFPMVHPADKPPDADWLYEVLGLNDIDIHETARGNVVEDPIISTMDVGGTVNSTATTSDEAREQLLSALGINTAEVDVNPPDVDVDVNSFLVEDEKNSNEIKLMSEDEIVESRKVALELRFESQQNSVDHEILSTLLGMCRSKQQMIQDALERSMESSSEVGTGSEVDETHVATLLELNELLHGALTVAESSIQTTSKNVGEDGIDEDGIEQANEASTTTEKSNPAKKPKESNDEGHVSWAKVDKKPAPTATKSAPKKAKPKKSKKNGGSDNIKQEEKPAVASAGTEDASTPAEVEDPKEKMHRLLEEARKQSAAAREKKKSKKTRKHDRWLKQIEEAKESRAKSWARRIAEENDYTDLIRKLLIAEFLRQSQKKAMGLTAERVLSDSDASDTLIKECREAYQTIFGGPKCRVAVADSEHKDMNGRQGTIRHWDREKAKYCVGLDTKKAPDNDVHFLLPEVLDLLPQSRSTKADKKSAATSYPIDLPDLINYGGVSLGFSFTLLKSHVIALGSAESTKVGLEAFHKSREKEEHQRKMEEEADRIREEEDRRRRAARRAQENAERERRKEKMRRDKEEYEKMKRDFGGRDNWASMFDFDEEDDDADEEDDDEECECPRCRYRDNFFFASFFGIGGIPFGFGFDGSESFFDDGFDERWDEKIAEERDEEDRAQAEILGVEPDADERTIKLAYRKMALQYHPDKWKSDSEHGMTRDDAENHFKAIQSAYDHLMSNFDD